MVIVSVHRMTIFGHLPEPNRAWLLVVYFSRQASQLWVYQLRDCHVYIPNTYQTHPVSQRLSVTNWQILSEASFTGQMTMLL